MTSPHRNVLQHRVLFGLKIKVVMLSIHKSLFLHNIRLPYHFILEIINEHLFIIEVSVDGIDYNWGYKWEIVVQGEKNRNAFPDGRRGCYFQKLMNQCRHMRRPQFSLREWTINSCSQFAKIIDKGDLPAGMDEEELSWEKKRLTASSML